MRSKLLASHVTKLDRDRSGAWRRVRLSDQIATLSGRIDIKHGWTAASFQDELEQHTGFRLEPAVEEKPPEDIYRDHVGIHQQKQPDYCYVGAAVLRARITAEQMRAAADFADSFAGANCALPTCRIC